MVHALDRAAIDRPSLGIEIGGSTARVDRHHAAADLVVTLLGAGVGRDLRRARGRLRHRLCSFTPADQNEAQTGQHDEHETENKQTAVSHPGLRTPPRPKPSKGGKVLQLDRVTT